MFDHVTIGAADREAARRFYSTVLPALGDEPRGVGPEWGDFSIQQAGDGRPVTTRLHIGFAAPSRAHVDAFWRAGVEAGYRDDGAPGSRPQYSDDYYGAFLLDPDGDSVEAVVHGSLRVGGCIDHVWIRVADRRASRRFYATIAPHANFREVADLADRTRYSRAPRQGSFSSSTASRPRRSTSRSQSGTRRRLKRSTAPRPRPASLTTAGRVSGRSTTRGTSARSCSIPTGTTSKPFTTALTQWIDAVRPARGALIWSSAMRGCSTPPQRATRRSGGLWMAAASRATGSASRTRSRRCGT